MRGDQGDWETYLSSHFLGYLLPSSAAVRLEEAAARRFLSRLSDRPNALELLRSATSLAPHFERFVQFTNRLLPELLRVLPSRNAVIVRRWEGGFHGRLNLRRTLEERIRGSPGSFVTSSRRRDYSLPENMLVRKVVEWLASQIESLRLAGLLSASGWGASYLGQEAKLRRVLGASRLAEVELGPVSSMHVEAAREARHLCYKEAVWWWQLAEESQTRNQERLAQLVATGALLPLAPETRFELAVVVRLLEALEARLCQGGTWKMERCLVMPGRDEVARFHSAEGRAVRVFYNQCVLPPGPADLGARHYLGQSGRLRPDVTVTVEHNATRLRGHVFEAKLSSSSSYLLGGFHEAILYANEYAEELRGWPKSGLVSSSPLPGAPRLGDAVIAVDWDRWVPDEVVTGILDGLAT